MLNDKLTMVLKVTSQSALPFAILVLILLMVVPVPALVLDIGFIANIMISLAILMIALNAAKPLDFSAFPTILLLATLFRLGLNVASTRVVLVNGHEGSAAAGHVIEAFGDFLIGGDYIIGLLVFAVLLIINMIVITKGAGRVSEVSARFTLDALPGKQMAIDADLNAGLITAEEAKQRRQDVSTEADFYGSMDGASKFVKGDAIAGLLILGVNIVGGLILGTMRHNLAIGEAAEIYIVLAIGDALVAQIPALLLSIAAAAIVTRVTSPLDLNGQIAQQFGHSRAWAPVTVTLAILCLIPAMPQIVLVPATALSAYLWWRIREFENRPVAPITTPVESETPHQINWSDVSENTAIALEIGYGLVDLVDDRKGSPLIARITGIRRQLSRELGFVLPPVRIKDDLSLPANSYRIVVAGVTMGEDEVYPRDLLALDSGEVLEPLVGVAVKDPSFGLDAIWIAAHHRTDAVVAGYTVVDAPTVVATHVHNIIGSCAAELFGLDDGQALLDNLKESYPLLASGLSPQPVSLAMLTGVCRALLTERVPLRDFRRVAEAMVALGRPDSDVAELVEAVRQNIGALIVQTIVPARMPLPAITFARELEELLTMAAKANPAAQWPFEADLANKVTKAVSEAVQPLMMTARSFAVITHPACRAAVSRLLRANLSNIPVLSFLEIPENRQVEIMAVIGADTEMPALPGPNVSDDAERYS